MAKAKQAAEVAPKKSFIQRITGSSLLSRSYSKPAREVSPPAGLSFDRSPFAPAKPPPGVVPKEIPAGAVVMAQDESIVAHAKYALDEFNTPVVGWGYGAQNTALSQGYSFLGYTYLAELTQIPEYRRISEVISTEMTRRWIKLHSVSEDETKEDKLKELQEELERLNVQECFQRLALQDGFFGRAHLYIDTGKTDDGPELITPIGDGWNDVSKEKVRKGDLIRLQVVEAVWCYPAFYNANNPLKPDWYKPTQWFCMGTQMHATRLICFVAREVPDLLKPAYSFGGMSLTQMAKPYVDNWIRTRQAVSDLVYQFSIMVLKTNLGDSLSNAGSELFDRAKLFTNLRDNRGLMMVNSAPGTSDDEDLKNVSAPLTTLDILQAQAQEHMCTVSAIPKVKLLGLDPGGLNASSDGEIETFDDSIHANQERLFRHPLRTVIGFAMLNIWGKTDPDIDFTFEPLRSLNPKEEAEKRKIEAETDVIYTDGSILHPEEVRERIANEPDSPYAGLKVDDVPEPPEEENPNFGGEGGKPDGEE